MTPAQSVWFWSLFRCNVASVQSSREVIFEGSQAGVPSPLLARNVHFKFHQDHRNLFGFISLMLTIPNCVQVCQLCCDVFISFREAIRAFISIHREAIYFDEVMCFFHFTSTEMEHTSKVSANTAARKPKIQDWTCTPWCNRNP